MSKIYAAETTNPRLYFANNEYCKESDLHQLNIDFHESAYNFHLLVLNQLNYFPYLLLEFGELCSVWCESELVFSLYDFLIGLRFGFVNCY
jgi:hypothetical protein